jgi:3-hydroxy-9,10-secoandrosta-1,3,5(10)-triene-9,17-dione monooxygenase
VQTKAANTVTPEMLVQRARDMIPRLKERAQQTETERKVPDQTVAEMQAAGLFEVLKPKQYGGYEMDPQVFYDVCMTLAEGCMSTAWIYGVIGVHNWQIALFDPRAAADQQTLIASTYMPKGQVTPVEGGFKFSGRWGFSSGVDHCQWVFLGGLIFSEGQPPEYRTFLLPRSDFEVIDTWHVMGLKGTGSKDIVVKDVFVPEYRTHRGIDGFMGTNPGRDTFTADLYKLPFGQIFVRAVSSAAIGGLQGALDTFLEFAKVRVGDMGNKTSEQAPAQQAAADAALAIDEMKLVLNRNFEVLMTKIRKGQPLDDIAQRLHFRAQAAQVVERSAKHAYQLFSACGGRGIFTDFPLHRYMFDMMAARGHYANNPEQFGRNYGAVLLGRDNGDVFI